MNEVQLYDTTTIDFSCNTNSSKSNENRKIYKPFRLKKKIKSANKVKNSKSMPDQENIAPNHQHISQIKRDRIRRSVQVRYNKQRN